MNIKNNTKNTRSLLVFLLIFIVVPFIWYINSPELTLISVFFVSLATYLLLGCCLIIPPILALGIVGKTRKKEELHSTYPDFNVERDLE